jgi:hypothetical protein
MATSTVSAKLAGRLETIHHLEDRLAAYRREIIEAAAEDTGTPGPKKRSPKPLA